MYVNLISAHRIRLVPGAVTPVGGLWDRWTVDTRVRWVSRYCVLLCSTSLYSYSVTVGLCVFLTKLMNSTCISVYYTVVPRQSGTLGSPDNWLPLPVDVFIVLL
jgi:hypothetical protein